MPAFRRLRDCPGQPGALVGSSLQGSLQGSRSKGHVYSLCNFWEIRKMGHVYLFSKCLIAERAPGNASDHGTSAQNPPPRRAVSHHRPQSEGSAPNLESAKRVAHQQSQRSPLRICANRFSKGRRFALTPGFSTVYPVADDWLSSHPMQHCCSQGSLTRPVRFA